MQDKYGRKMQEIYKNEILRQKYKFIDRMFLTTKYRYGTLT